MKKMPQKNFGIGVTAVAAAHVVLFAFHYVSKKRKEESELSITLPDWAHQYVDSLKNDAFTSENEMMAIAVELSRLNVAHNTGGPFGCAIFEVGPDGKGELFSVGVNRVVSLGNSTLHGEMIAIQYAQKKLQSFSLRRVDTEYHMYTSCEPCAMCLGGTLWSGVSKLVCAATKDDAEAIGFNEGPVYPESYKALEKAGCKVVRNVLQKEGALVLQNYGKEGVIYNA